VGQEVRHLQEFVVILDPDHPVLGKDRIVPGIGTRQRSSMRACSPGSEFRTPDFDQDDRLAALCCELCHFEEFIGLFEAFDKAGNDPRIRIDGTSLVSSRCSHSAVGRCLMMSAIISIRSVALTARPLGVSKRGSSARSGRSEAAQNPRHSESIET
jgi:hypothetical protein